MRSVFSTRILPTFGVCLFALPHCLLAQSASIQVASGLSNPLFVTAAPGDSDRVFILEQGGGGTARIKTMNLGTGTVATYMTISGIQTGGERGLLGLAFHPDFANNGQFYVNVTANNGFGNQTQIRRYTANGDPLTSTSGNLGSLQQVLSFGQPFSNHNGGWIGFDPTGDNSYLYIATGDGGSGGDPQNNSQDITNNKLGKMLRVDVDGDDFVSPSANYAIPPSNPFVGVTGDDEIWSYGLRNPYRSSFDRRSGDLWIGDVGQVVAEEIDRQPADSAGGENYGWRVLEGNSCFDNSQTGGNPPCSDPSLVPPVYTYPRNGGPFGGFVVTGGYVYDGSVDRFGGLYFFADFATENVWTIDPYSTNIQGSVQNRNGILPTDVSSFNGISSFGEDASGELFIVSYSNGRIYRIESTASDAEWNGDTAVGTPGDGTTWANSNNWTRDGAVDSGFVTQDTVIFLPGSTQPQITLAATQIVSAVEFRGSYTLAGEDLQVLSGDISVIDGVVATIQNDLFSETANQSLRKRGNGTLVINGAAPQTVVLGGTLAGMGTISNLQVFESASVAPGDGVGSLVVAANYVQKANSSLQMELGGTTPISEYDQLTVGGQADLAGELQIVDVNGFGPTTRGSVDQFVLVVASTVSGSFDSATYNGDPMVAIDGVNPDGSFVSHAGDGLFQSLLYSSTDVTLERYFALPGDANGDGTVDVEDFNIWTANRFTNGTDWLTGDFNNDGATDLSDLHLWNEFKFQSVNLVPEPSAAGLALFALLGISLYTRRKN